MSRWKSLQIEIRQLLRVALVTGPLRLKCWDDIGRHDRAYGLHPFHGRNWRNARYRFERPSARIGFETIWVSITVADVAFDPEAKQVAGVVVDSIVANECLWLPRKVIEIVAVTPCRHAAGLVVHWG
jgi:hypothetical protein